MKPLAALLLAVSLHAVDAPRARRARPVPPAARYDELARQADAAREENRIADAIDLYRKALRLRSSWKEGQWYLGTLLYDQDRCAEARLPLRRFVALESMSAPGWALLGLCDFQTAEYKAAYTNLNRALTLGSTLR